ncbi:hypothetical protein VULLAG_LOCUS4 [Vulpes lagopus]
MGMFHQTTERTAFAIMESCRCSKSQSSPCMCLGVLDRESGELASKQAPSDAKAILAASLPCSLSGFEDHFLLDS